jgi:carboxypeptidase family protein
MSAVRWSVAIAVLLGVPAVAVAQVTTADIVGRVTDATGAVLPGATVTIENVGTHDVRTMPSNETGDYLFNLLPIGAYTVKVELQGFNTQATRVTLSAGDRVRVDARLQIGQMAENVTVAAEAPLLQTDTATVSSLVSEKPFRTCRSAAATSCGSCSSCPARSKGCRTRSRPAIVPTIDGRPPPSRSTARWTIRTTT